MPCFGCGTLFWARHVVLGTVRCFGDGTLFCIPMFRVLKVVLGHSTLRCVQHLVLKVVFGHSTLVCVRQVALRTLLTSYLNETGDISVKTSLFGNRLDIDTHV